MTKLNFLQQDAVTVAQQLLGWGFYKQEKSGLIGGIIVETEAYTSQDAASHSYRGQTPRNEVMFGPSGRLYVYFTYGLHYCANIVTGPVGDGQAVLLRALIPTAGIDHMRTRRQRPDGELTNGPAKLSQSLGIDLQHNGQTLNSGDFLLTEPTQVVTHLAPSPRIGINYNSDALWRFTASL